MKSGAVAVALAGGVLLAAGSGPGISAGQSPPVQQEPAPDEARLLARLADVQRALQSGNAELYLSLLSPAADRARAAEFAAFEIVPNATRAVVRQRERLRLPGTLPGQGYRLVLDVFTELGDRARAATWRLDVRLADDGQWWIADQERLSGVENLYRLSVNPARQFTARNFTVSSIDFQLTLVEGSVFTIDTDQGVTGLVLLGQGEMRFAPPSDTEKGQVRIFAGAEQLRTRFSAAYVRVRDLNDHADPARLQPRGVDERELRRAQEVFREEAPKSFVLDLADLSPEPWSLLPSYGDFVAEVRTRGYDTLTYARSGSEAEDVALFNRERHRNISVYASPEKIAARGRFYNEDDLAAIDVLDYDLDVAFEPERHWLEGRARIRLRIRSGLVNQLTLRIADSLTAHSIASDRHGRLFNMRVKGQNAVLVNLPVGVPEGTEMMLAVAYSGRLGPQSPDREVLALQQDDRGRGFEPQDLFTPRVEPILLYSNRSYWYPQPTVTDFATATIRLNVPDTSSVVASGEPAVDSPTLVETPGGGHPRKVYTFEVDRPVRYLAFVASRFVRADRVTIEFDDRPVQPVLAPPDEEDDSSPSDGAGDDRLVAGAVYDSLDLTVEAHPTQVSRGRQIVSRAADVVRFYQSVVGDSPYPAFTLALVENTLPGGHSPGYFALLNQPLPNAPITWRNDPAAFNRFPEFFLAHEIAHQWWGQAVGWRNYHEQWLSEGFAQYFAAMYAQHAHGDEVFGEVLKQMRRWAIRESDQGPVYLGYRLGHIRNDSRVFRALVYNKGAAVLHMLRRLVGDEAFFRGVRRFYVGARFTKAGTDDLRAAMEAESGQPLERFFERWIYGSTLPQVTLSHRVEGNEAVLRVEQHGEPFDLPITVTLEYADRPDADVLVRVVEPVVEARVPLEGRLRGVEVRDEHGVLAEVRKTS